MKLTMVIACFNEKTTILKAIEEAKAVNIDKEIIIIDNCSTDGTRELLQGLKNDKDLRIILHSKNMGVGYSGREGMELAKGEYFSGLGADLEYSMRDVQKMMEKMERESLDVVFGSRLLDRKNVPIFTLIKERPYWLGTIIATSLINLFYGRNFTDVIGSSLIKTKILKATRFNSNGHAAAVELVSKLCRAGYKIAEEAVSYTPRTHQQGKTIKAVDTVIPALWAILKVKIFG